MHAATTVEEVLLLVVIPSAESGGMDAQIVAAQQLSSVSVLNATLAENSTATDADAIILFAKNKLLAARVGDLKSELDDAQGDSQLLEQKADALK